VYVIWDERHPNKDGPFVMEMEQLIASALLKGEAFEKMTRKYSLF
jgi:hypothetical protein